MMRSGQVVALFQLLRNLASCPLLRFSSAMRRTPLRVHRIRPHQRMLRPVPPRHRIPAILPPLTVALADEAEEEEEAETEEEHRPHARIHKEHSVLHPSRGS
jgi:hypothetical protein